MLNTVFVVGQTSSGIILKKDAKAEVVFICPKIGDNISIPQIITPNNDGVNDTWDVEDLKSVSICNEHNKVVIFNRWGAKVYEKCDYMSDDERFRGYSENSLDFQNEELLPAGTYFYIIEINGGINKTGYLYITTP